jgi:hypothetical protein
MKFSALARLAALAAGVLLMASLGHAQGPPSQSITIQLSPVQGRSLGLIDPPPQDGSPAATSDLLPFGNYVSASTGRDVLARSYLYFPLPDLADTVVESATLEVYVDSWPFEGEATIGVYLVTEDWDETMTWPTRAELAPTPVSTARVSSTAAWYAWSVSALVLGWQTGIPNYGLALAAVPPQDSRPLTAPGWAGRGPGRTGANPALAPRLVLHTSQVTPTFTPPPTFTPVPTQAPLPTLTAPPPPPAPIPSPEATLAVTPLPTPMLLPQTGGSQLEWWLPWPGLAAGVTGLWAVQARRKRTRLLRK